MGAMTMSPAFLGPRKMCQRENETGSTSSWRACGREPLGRGWQGPQRGFPASGLPLGHASPHHTPASSKQSQDLLPGASAKTETWKVKIKAGTLGSQAEPELCVSRRQRSRHRAGMQEASTELWGRPPRRYHPTQQARPRPKGQLSLLRSG